jgi:hypothetical protein
MDESRRQEIIEAYGRHSEARQAQDWHSMADLFAEDASYFDPIFGWHKGREEIRRFLCAAADGLAEREFREVWWLADDKRVVLYWECTRPGEESPVGGGPQYHGMTTLRYAGSGLWDQQMDIYDRQEAKDSRAAASLD